MLKTCLYGLIKFIHGCIMGIIAGIAIAVWILDKLNMIDYKRVSKYYECWDKKRNAN